MNKGKKAYLFLALFIIGAWIRGMDAWRMVDGSARELWRECDIAAVAKNYYREGMNIFYPRIDWRGDGPGFAEMEFPLFPWTVAVLYKIFGYNEAIGRLLSFAFSLLTLVLFFQLARYLLNPFGALIASTFMTLSPVIIRISNALQPEALMLLFYVLAAYAFMRWIDDDKWTWYGLSLVATALAILSKINAAHIGLFFLLFLFMKKGAKSLLKFRVWVFGILSLLPAVLWYLHAQSFWKTYGNSLGISNEYHWVGWDLFTNPKFILGLAEVEVSHIWMPLGGLIGLYALWSSWSKGSIKIILAWLLAIAIYYIVSIRTTGENWATYYHVVTIPPAALLFGEGVERIKNLWARSKILQCSIILSVAITLMVILGQLFSVIKPNILMAGIATFLISLLLVLASFWWVKVRDRLNSSAKGQPLTKSILVYGLQFCILSTFLFQGFRISIDLHPNNYQVEYQCAQSFKPYVPENILIVVSGGPTKDDSGYQVASNASQMFFWIDRKGFSVSYEDHNIEAIKRFRERGARYFIFEKSASIANPGFEDDLRSEFTILEECEGIFLVKLSEK